MDIDWEKTHAAIWRQHKQYLRPVSALDPISLDDLVGIEEQKNQLIHNTQRFVSNKPANNALLWGARGTGKSSLIKATLNHFRLNNLRLIEIQKSDLQDLPEIIDDIRNLPQKFIIYCDDFSFEENESSYIALKTIIDGSIELPPSNILLYVTSNRRHLMPEYMSDNEGTKIVDGNLHYSDTVEEKISLSDRFGLWLSFYPQDINNFLRIVDSYFPDFSGDRDELHRAAKLFAATRSSRSGRTAKQFYNHYSG